MHEGGLGDDLSDLPAAGAAPEWMSEKAIAIGHYFVASGHVRGPGPPVLRRGQRERHQASSARRWRGSPARRFDWEPDPARAAEKILAHIETKRDALGINAQAGTQTLRHEGTAGAGMSKIIASSAIRGRTRIVRHGRGACWPRRVAAKGADHAPSASRTRPTALPVIYSLLGRARETLAGHAPAFSRSAARCCRRSPDQVLAALPGRHPRRRRGDAVRLRDHRGLQVPDRAAAGATGIWLGAANDVIMRERGIEFVDGSAPGFAAVVGAAPTQRRRGPHRPRAAGEEPLRLHGRPHQRRARSPSSWPEAGVQLGWETRLVPFGKEISAAIYALGFANRVALSFGGVQARRLRRATCSTTRTASSPS